MNYRHVLTAAALCTIALGTVSAQQGDKKAPATVQQQAKPDSAKKASKMDSKKSTKGKKKGAMKKDAKDSTKAAAKKP